MLDWNLFTAVDWFIVGVLGVSVLISVWRGFLREAISLAGWVAAFVVANMFAPRLAVVIAPWITNVTGQYLAGYAILFVGTLLTAGLLGRIGVELIEFDQARKEPVDRETGQAGYGDGGISAAFVTHLVAKIADLADAAGNRRCQYLSFVRRDRISRSPHKQGAADPFLDDLHMLADRTLRHAQFLGRARKTAQPDNRFEGTQGFQRRQRSLRQDLYLQQADRRGKPRRSA